MLVDTPDSGSAPVGGGQLWEGLLADSPTSSMASVSSRDGLQGAAAGPGSSAAAAGSGGGASNGGTGWSPFLPGVSTCNQGIVNMTMNIDPPNVRAVLVNGASSNGSSNGSGSSSNGSSSGAGGSNGASEAGVAALVVAGAEAGSGGGGVGHADAPAVGGKEGGEQAATVTAGERQPWWAGLRLRE